MTNVSHVQVLRDSPDIEWEAWTLYITSHELHMANASHMQVLRDSPDIEWDSQTLCMTRHKLSI